MTRRPFCYSLGQSRVLEMKVRTQYQILVTISTEQTLLKWQVL